MTNKIFRKILSANDVGSTGGHQGGILIPRSETELLAFLPFLDPSVKNPDAWIECEDEEGEIRKFRFIYYNNKLHDDGGTRNEYRITHMTKYLREAGTKEGDSIEISRSTPLETYKIRILSSTPSVTQVNSGDSLKIKIRSSWSRIH